MFIIIGCFLLKDSWNNPSFSSAVHLFWNLLFSLLLFSTPRFLLKGIIPEEFKINARKGFLLLGKYLIATFCSLLFVRLTITPHDWIFTYKWLLWFFFSITIYCHFRWEKGIKNRPSSSKEL